MNFISPNSPYPISPLSRAEERRLKLNEKINLFNFIKYFPDLMKVEEEIEHEQKKINQWQREFSQLKFKRNALCFLDDVFSHIDSYLQTGNEKLLFLFIANINGFKDQLVNQMLILRPGDEISTKVIKDRFTDASCLLPLISHFFDSPSILKKICIQVKHQNLDYAQLKNAIAAPLTKWLLANAPQLSEKKIKAYIALLETEGLGNAEVLKAHLAILSFYKNAQMNFDLDEFIVLIIRLISLNILSGTPEQHLLKTSFERLSSLAISQVFDHFSLQQIKVHYDQLARTL